MCIEGEHACTLWPETTCSPLPRTKARLCLLVEAIFMLPYLSAFCNSYLHHSRVRRLRLVAPSRPCRCPRASCNHADVPACQTHDHAASYPQSPRLVFHLPLAWQQAPTHWRSPRCWPAWYPLPLLYASSGGGSRHGKERRLHETRRIGFGAQPPCTLGRKALAPWGEIPWDFGTQPPCILGRKALVPLGEVSLDLGEKPLVPPGEVLCTLRRNSMT
jgi:hypothetical protein